MKSVKTHHVVIVGGGFGGLAAAKILGLRGSRNRDSNLQITLIDRRNHHLFQPLLYQVAMAVLSPADIAVPIRSILGGYSNTQVVMGNVTAIDLVARAVQADGQNYNYDYLILACGAKHSYFNHEEWEENAPGLKTLEQATEIRRRVLLAYEQAEAASDLVLQKKLLTFVVIGGGPTGVELAGALGEISRFTLGRDFHRINPRETRVLLIEAGPRVLASFDPALSMQAFSDLKSLGVEVRTSSRVTSVSSDGVELGIGVGKGGSGFATTEFISAATVLWAAGVQPSSLNKLLDAPLDPVGRVFVNGDLSLPGHPNVFVIGDQAHVAGSGIYAGHGLPGLAPVALQEGRHVARCILSDLHERHSGAAPRAQFIYSDKGQMATIGRKRAIAQVGNFKFSGFIAWLAWLVIHIYYLIGFKNRLFVLLQWAGSYFTFRRGARLILYKEWRTGWKKESDPN